MPSMNRWLPAAVAAAALLSPRSADGFTTGRTATRLPPPSSTASPSSSASSSPASPPSPPSQPDAAGSPPSDDGWERVEDATRVLREYDTSQQIFVRDDGKQGTGGGLSALRHVRSLAPSTRDALRDAVLALSDRAHLERASDSSRGRIMLGFCASNAPEALGGLKSWVTSVHLPRGNLHGMDVDGVPIPPEELGAVYVKYSTGGAMTFAQMRKSGNGFDALWRPGDALLEPYDGDFRGVYFTVELGDGEFRQFGVLPTDLFMEEEDDDW